MAHSALSRSRHLNCTHAGETLLIVVVVVADSIFTIFCILLLQHKFRINMVDSSTNIHHIRCCPWYGFQIYGGPSPSPYIDLHYAVHFKERFERLARCGSIS